MKLRETQELGIFLDNEPTKNEQDVEALLDNGRMEMIKEVVRHFRIKNLGKGTGS
jgi:hypothetical protein